MKRTLLIGIAVLAIAMVFGAVSVASADTVEYQGTDYGLSTDATGTVTVTAQANPKLTLTIETPDPTQSVAFGLLDPLTPASKTATVTVSSNALYGVTKNVTGDVAEMGLTTTWAGVANAPRGSTSYPDVYSVSIPFTTDPSLALVAYVEYTVTQI